MLLAACAAKSPEAEGARLAQQVIHSLEVDSRSLASQRRAAAELERARALAPEDPWVALAAADLALAAGYTGGDAFGRSSYRAQALKAAEDQVKRALQIAPEIAHAHRSLARVQQLRGRLQEAWLTLNEAYRLEPEHPRAWLLRSVISLQMHDAPRAHALLEEAELRAHQVHQKREVLAQRARIARIGGDHEQHLAMLQQLIDLEPDNPHAHGDLGVALIALNREAEAVPHLERAVALGRDDLVERQLASARQGQTNPYGPRREAALQTDAEEDTKATRLQRYR